MTDLPAWLMAVRQQQSRPSYRAPRPMPVMRPAWERQAEAQPEYQRPLPRQALADPNTVPIERRPTRAQREFGQYALQDTAQRSAGASEGFASRDQVAEFGQGAMEATGAPAWARGIRHVQQGEPGEAIPEFLWGALNTAGIATLPFGGGARGALTRQPMGMRPPPRVPRPTQNAPPPSRTGPDAGPVQGENGPIRVYHGSPHSFDRFSLDHIGTGEGNARFGYGAYVAENQGVGRSYQQNLAPSERLVNGAPFDASNPVHVAADAVGQTGGNRASAIRELQRQIRAAGGTRTPEGLRLSQAIRAINESAEGGSAIPRVTDTKGASYLYEADLNVTPAEILDLDLPWAQQPAQVRESLGQYMPQGATHMDDLYQNMIDELGSAQAAAQALRERGFRALAYLDQGSREAGAGTRNYVVFDDSALAVRSRNGEQISPHTAPDGGSARLRPATRDLDTGQIYTGDNHFFSAEAAQEAGARNIDLDGGFVDQAGNYLTREEAARRLGISRTRADAGDLDPSRNAPNAGPPRPPPIFPGPRNR